MDKLSTYLREIDSSNQEEDAERDYYINILFMRGFKYKSKTKQQKK